MKMRRLFFLLILFGSFAQMMQAQSDFRKCGADDHRDYLQEKYPAMERQIRTPTAEIIDPQEVGKRELITIPVVVHIIYNEAIENVSDAVIFSQIDALNEDFGMNNVEIDAIPSNFQNDIANVEFEFCLAQRDPQGNETNGIVRKSTNQNQFSDQTSNIFYDNEGGSTAWDDTQYMNIWVCNLGSFLAGFATFPNDAPSGEDGIVINYTNFGRMGLDPPYHLGRTTTHEVGHFFGIEHPWGGGIASCNSDDGINDTPNTNKTYLSECPNGAETSCGSTDMHMNFMYYTDDACMAMFSKGQKAVMVNQLDNFRSGLKNSNGCSPVSVIDQELQHSITVFPNPVSNFINLQLTVDKYVPLTMRILNYQGQELFIGNYRNQIAVTNFASGIYLVVIHFKQGTVTKKVVIH